MQARAFDYERAGPRDRGVGHHHPRYGRLDARLLQRLLRHVEAADGCILIEITQDIGQLQGASEMVREQPARLAFHAEHAHRKPSDRARDTVAIEVERGEGWPWDVVTRAHPRAAEAGEEPLAREINLPPGLRKARSFRADLALV